MAWKLPDGCVLGIFGQQPEPGRVLTRLVPSIGPEAASSLYEAMLFDRLDLWDSPGVIEPGGRRVLVYDPPDAGPWFDERVPDSFALQPQVEGSLGDRMAAFLEGELEDGATRVVLIGCDAPTLDPAFVISAFLCLKAATWFWGPPATAVITWWAAADRCRQSSRTWPGARPAFSPRQSTGLTAPVSASRCFPPGTISTHWRASRCFVATFAPCNAPGWTRSRRGPRRGWNEAAIDPFRSLNHGPATVRWEYPAPRLPPSRTWPCRGGHRRRRRSGVTPGWRRSLHRAAGPG